MAGIEPASERFDPRKSTSVVGRGLSSQRSRPTGTLCDQPLIFRTFSGVVCGTPPLFRPIRHLAEEGAGGRALIKESGCYVYRLCSEGHSSVWSAIGTWFFALSLRVRRLSARIPGPASPVEACHPQSVGTFPINGRISL